MICPYCHISIHFEESGYIVFPFDEESEEELGFGFSAGFCPSCGGIILKYQEGEYATGGRGEYYLLSVSSERVIYPIGNGRSELPVEVPKPYRDDYKEASLVLEFSPKASAALSRRCLQCFLNAELNIKKGSLVQEIEEFINTQKVPSFIIECVDAIRNVGNFAAHPLKDKSTGEIVDVEPGESEWLLDVLEALFDFYFVQPQKLQERKDKLNKKLADLGKPLMN